MPQRMLSTPDVESSQRDKAYHLLRRMLILQRIADGERLREPVWAERLGVNRMALREAFARLEAEGLIERGAKTGYVVPKLSPVDMREILDVRATLESLAVETIIREKRNGRRQLRPLDQAIHQMQSLIDSGYLLGASEADRSFHEQLVQLSGNRRLWMIYQRAPLPMIHSGLINTPRWEPEMRRS
jgi:DNA-binding GntR family transcriptional regulator